MQIIERFWTHVQRCEHGAECVECCWPWQGFLMGWGYGQFFLWSRGKNTRVQAHRMSWMFTYGDIPHGLCVLHNCPAGDNPACVNPGHLWLGTLKENTHDAIRKGRFASGERNGAHTHPEAVLRGSAKGNARFHEEQILDIRYLAGQGMSHRLLGHIYAMHRANITLIVQGKVWKHLPIIVEER